MDSSPATRERENGAQGNEVQEDDYMGDLSQFLPSDAFDPPKISSSKKVTSDFTVLPFFVVVLILPWRMNEIRSLTFPFPIPL